MLQLRYLVSVWLVIILICVISAIPLLTNNAPADEAWTDNSTIHLNVSVTETNITKVIHIMNGENYTLFDNSTVLYMNFNNRSELGEDGSFLADISNTANHGTLVAGVESSDCIYEKCLSFDGTTTPNMTIPHFKEFPSNNITAMAWVKTSAAGGTVFSYSRTASGTSNEFLIYDLNAIQVFVDGTGKVTTVDINDGEWHHLTVTWQTNGVLKIYDNGALTYSTTGHQTGSTMVTDGCFTVGQEQDTDCGTYSDTQSFDGEIDEIQLFNRSLTDAEIRFQYMSNLKKMDIDSWEVFIKDDNRSSEFINGSNTHNMGVYDTAGDGALAGEETLNINSNPNFAQVYQNMSATYPTYQIERTILDGHLEEVVLYWNETNATLMDNSTLVLHYNFNNLAALGESSTLAYDASGNKNHGTMGNTGYTSVGKYDGAINFEGASDVLYVERNIDLESTEWTMCTWSNFPLSASASTWRTLMRGSDDDHNVIVDGAGNLGVYENGGGNDVQCSPTVDTDTYSGWHHLCAIATDADTTTEFLIDGEPVCNSSVRTGGQFMAIGNHWGLSQDWGAELDDFRLYTEALTHDEIRTLYASSLAQINQTNWKLLISPNSHNGGSGLANGEYPYSIYAQDHAGNPNITAGHLSIKTAHVSFFSPPTPADNAISAETTFPVNVSMANDYFYIINSEYNWNGTNYTVLQRAMRNSYNFDNVASIGDSPTQSKGLGHYYSNATISGAVYVEGVYGMALDFDGINDYAHSGDNAYMDTADTFTMSLWFNRDTDGTNETNHGINNVLFAQSSNTANDNVEIGTDGTNVEMYFDASANHFLTYDAGIQNDVWYHLTVTFDEDDTSGEVTLYINGVEVNSWTDTTADLDDSATSKISYGMARAGDGGWGWFDGTIDEPRLWNNTFTADEVWMDYISNLKRVNMTNWEFTVNQSKSATSMLGDSINTYGLYTQWGDGNTNSTPIRTYTRADVATCPGTPQNWAVDMSDYIIVNEMCNLSGFNITFSETGNFTVNTTLYVKQFNGFDTGRAVYIKPNGVVHYDAD